MRFIHEKVREFFVFIVYRFVNVRVNFVEMVIDGWGVFDDTVFRSIDCGLYIIFSVFEFYKLLLTFMSGALVVSN